MRKTIYGLMAGQVVLIALFVGLGVYNARRGSWLGVAFDVLMIGVNLYFMRTNVSTLRMLDE